MLSTSLLLLKGHVPQQISLTRPRIQNWEQLSVHCVDFAFQILKILAISPTREFEAKKDQTKTGFFEFAENSE
jgi:hypothetical protein